MKKQLSWFKEYLKEYRNQIALALLLGLITYGCATLLMFTSGYLIAKTADSATTLFMVMTPVAFVQLFGLGRPVARYFERLVSHDWALRITSKLRLRLFRTAEALAENPDKNRTLGTYLGVLTSDIGHLQNLFLRVVFPVFITITLLIGACIFCGIFSFQLLILMIFIGLTCVIVLPYLALLLNHKNIQKDQALKQKEYETLTDNILGSMDWIRSGRNEEVFTLHKRNLSILETLSAKTRFRDNLLELFSILSMGIAICVCVFIGSDVFGTTRESSNWIAAFVLGLFPLLEVFMLLPSAVSSSLTYQASLQNLDSFFDSNSKSDFSFSNRISKEKSVQDCKTHVPLPNEKNNQQFLKIEAITFSYPSQKRETIKNLNLEVFSGEKLAILGRSGSGKSTLLELILGHISAQNGSITLQGCPLDEIECLSKEIGYLDQAPYIFNRSLRDNLLIGNAKATDEELIAALQNVGLEEKFSSLPKGLDTTIGETGIGFSGGEAHRIALARVLLAKTPLVLLDEPFSALDPETEQELLETLFTVMKNKTLIVVTHHLAKIDCFDHVVFIENGQIALEGTPKELKATSSYFQTLCSLDASVLSS